MNEMKEKVAALHKVMEEKTAEIEEKELKFIGLEKKVKDLVDEREAAAEVLTSTVESLKAHANEWKEIADILEEDLEAEKKSYDERMGRMEEKYEKVKSELALHEAEKNVLHERIAAFERENKYPWPSESISNLNPN